MIVVGLCGGLGNQLFQYATGRRLAHLRGTELVLDLGWFDHRPSSNTIRDYELGRYPIQARSVFPGEAFWCRLHQGRILRRIPLFPRRWRHYRERSFEFDPAVLTLPDNTYLDGYWQSYKYFADIAPQIRQELTPVHAPAPQDETIAAKMAASGGRAVSLHVRRGDYVTNPAAAKMHGLCSPAYYERAVNTIAQRVVQPHFFVFSDDMPWVRNHLRLPGEVTYVDHNGPATAFQDLRLMSLCSHHVVANSSFSWWGAWLSGREDGCVIAPAAWFADARNTADLTPEHWIRL